MINKPAPFKGLHIRIPIIIPAKGRGFINHGSTLINDENTKGTLFLLFSFCKETPRQKGKQVLARVPKEFGIVQACL